MTVIDPAPATGASRPAALRMRDLTKNAGLSRQAIHFYIDEGLLPPPEKKGRNTALYSHEHLERLRWIQRLQREHFLSLNAIKAVLNGEDVESFTPQQRTLLRRVRDQLPGWARPTSKDTAKVADVISNRISEDELRELEQAGLIELRGSGGSRAMSRDDADIAECFARYKEAGATRERGYRPAHLAILDRAIELMVEDLAHVYAQNWAHVSGDEAIAYLEAVIPIDERLLATLLRKKMRALAARIADSDGDAPDTQNGSKAKRKRRQ